MFSNLIRNHAVPKFILVGVVGFLVDASVLTLLVLDFGLGHYAGRGCSFSLAVTVTWYLNRRFVFVHHRPARAGTQYVKYIFTQVVGSLVNLALYVLALEFFPVFKGYPVIPLSVGAFFAAVFNYLVMKKWVFAEKLPERGKQWSGNSE